VDLVGHGLDAVGPLLRVRYELALVAAALGRPAVVDVDVLVAEVLEAERDELVGGVERVAGRCRVALRDVLER